MRRYLTQAIALFLLLSVAVAAWAVVKTNRRGTGGIEYDAPRTALTFRGINFTAATAEGLVTLTPSRDYVDGATCTTCTVTASKRMRITNACITTKNAGAAGQGVIVRIRVNPSAGCTTTSPVMAALGAGTYLAIANVVGSTCTLVDVDNTLEISGSAQICVSQIGTATAGNDVVVMGYEY